MRNKDIFEKIEARIESRGLTPELVFIDAGMTASNYKLAQKGTLHACDLVRLCQLLDLKLEDFETEPIKHKDVTVYTPGLMHALAEKPNGIQRAIELVGNFVPTEITPEQAIRIHHEITPRYPLDWILLYDGNPQFRR